MGFWRSITGLVDVELTSAEPEAALTAINAVEIEIWRLRQIDDLTCRFRISRKDYPALYILCKKRGERLRVYGRKGIYWLCRSLIGRPVLVSGLIVFLLLVFGLPTRVLFVQVEGNEMVPDRKILEAAESCGIGFGAACREVRSEKMKNALLAAVPELQWAGVNTSGCTAIISVREGTDTAESEPKLGIANIVAARDGYILSGTTVRGTALFQPGQTVKEGQILISGYTDAGICVQATSAEGEVYAQTSRKVKAVMPAEWRYKTETGAIKKKYSLMIRKKRINLWKDSGISDASCDRMYEEYYVTLPGGFRLPIALCVERFVFYASRSETISQMEAENALSEFAKRYVMQEMVAGGIQSCMETVTLSNGRYCLSGSYICTEMIGRVQREQIGEINGKSG